MLQAAKATVSWDPSKKRWQLHIQAGAEVIKRALSVQQQDAGDEVLRPLAVTTAKDEGYALDPALVSISH